MSTRPADVSTIPPHGSVRPILQHVLGMNGPHNLIEQIVPTISVISVASYRPGVQSNAPTFTFSPSKVGRLGIFAASNGRLERAVILLLPKGGRPDRVLIGISHGFGQNWGYYSDLGAERDPLSPALIKDVLLYHVVNRWGAQMLAGKKNMALVHIVRAFAGGPELGPFAADGPFVKAALSGMAELTDHAFSFEHVEAFTYSSGVKEFNTFLSKVTPVLNVEVAYEIDPAPPEPAVGGSNLARRQFLSGMTGGPRAGFEFMPLERWKHEDDFPRWAQIGQFDYLHNGVMPDYILHLGIQTS